MLLSWLFRASLGCLLLMIASSSSSAPLSRHVEVMNDSGHNVVIHWVNPKTGELVRFTEPFLNNGATMSFDSYVNQSFIVQEANNDTTCSSNIDHSCHASHMTITDHDPQVVFIRDGIKLEYHDRVLGSRAAAGRVVEPCREEATWALEQGEAPEDVMETFMSCLEDVTVEAFQTLADELAFEQQLRLEMSDQLEPYTCLGKEPTSTPIETRQWQYEGVTHEVGVLHQRKASQIHVLRNFISPEECEAIRLAAEPTLHRGTVADGKGGSELSDSRKAWQAGVPMPFDDEDDLIGQVGRRLYAYANHATGYNLTYDGQEDLMSIQYFGRGADDPAPDQYKPHCDCDCGGLPHKTGGRVATMVMYCDVPKVGGGTNFQNAGVYVKPELGAAAFFSYMDAETHVMENGFTTHSGCPVLEGTKRIAVHWMRIGVDEESPWDSYNTLNVKRNAEEEGDCQ